MGARPSNQDLLDWLAVDFVDSEWNFRRMIKLMVMSATYRQSEADFAAEIGERTRKPDSVRAARTFAWMPRNFAIKRSMPPGCSSKRLEARRSSHINPKACGKRWR